MNNDDTFFDRLPEDWDVVKIGSVFDIKQGKSLSSRKQTGEYLKPFLRTSNVLWGRLDLSHLDEMDFTDDECNTLTLEHGDLLVCEGGDIGRTTIWRNEKTECYYQNHLHRLRVKDKRIEPLFIMYWMQVALTQLGIYEGFGNKTTIPNLSSSRLREFILPLPEKKEQQKIAAILSKIQQAIEIQESIIVKMRELKKSTLHHVFTHGLRGEKLKETEIGPIPKSWDIKRIEDIFRLSSGKTRPAMIRKEKSDPFPFPIYGGNGVMAYTNQYFVTNDVLILGRVGEYCGAVHVSCGNAWISDNALYSKDWIDSNISVNYMAAYLKYFDLNRLKRKSSQPLVTQGTVHRLIIPVPRNVDQEYIANIVNNIDKKIAIQTEKKSALQDLFKTMLNKLMTGEIRVKDLDIDVSEVES
jgi:type I restriction enzyme S subunit